MIRDTLTPSYRAALLHVLLCVICWALIPNFAGEVRRVGLDPSQYLFWSNVVSAAVLLAATCASGQVGAFGRYRVRDLLVMAGLGVLGSFAYYALLYTAYYDAPEGSAPSLMILQYTWPALTAVLSGLVLRERFTPRASAALALGILAVGCAFGNAALPALRELSLVGIAAVTFAIYSVVAKTRRFEPYTYVTIVFIAGAACSAFWMAHSSSWYLPGTWKAWQMVLLNGAVANGLSYVWWQRALRLAPASFVAPWVCVTPLLGTSIYWASGAGGLQSGHWVGVVLVFLSVWCSMVSPSPPDGGPTERARRLRWPRRPGLAEPPPVETAATSSMLAAAPVGRYQTH